MLNDEQAILKYANCLKARAKSLACGMEAELMIVVSVGSPESIAVCAPDHPLAVTPVT